MLQLSSAMAKCPTTHPVAIEKGMYCCKSYNSINDSYVDLSCDGSPLKFSSLAVCCPQDIYADLAEDFWMIPCPEKICNKGKPAVCEEVSMVTSPSAYSTAYLAKFVLEEHKRCETSYNIFVSPDFYYSGEFIVDLGCQRTVKSFIMQNLRWGGHRLGELRLV